MSTPSRLLLDNLVGRKVIEAARKGDSKPDLYFDIINKQDIDSTAAWLQDYMTALKKGQFQAYSPLERKVRAITRKGTKVPSKSQLQELIEYSFNSEFRQIMFSVLHERLNQPRYKWSNIYKALIVIETLLIHGSEDCMRDAFPDVIRLTYLAESYEYIDWKGEDQGVEIRMKAEAILKLFYNTKRLARKRLEVTVEAWQKSSRVEVDPSLHKQWEYYWLWADDDSCASEDDTEEIFGEFAPEKEMDLQSLKCEGSLIAQEIEDFDNESNNFTASQHNSSSLGEA